MKISSWSGRAKILLVAAATTVATTGTVLGTIGAASGATGYAFAMRFTASDATTFVMLHIQSIKSVAGAQATAAALGPAQMSDATTALGSAPTGLVVVTKNFGDDDKAHFMPALLGSDATRVVTKMIWQEKYGADIVATYRAPKAWLVSVHRVPPKAGTTGLTRETAVFATAGLGCGTQTRSVPTSTTLPSGTQFSVGLDVTLPSTTAALVVARKDVQSLDMDSDEQVAEKAVTEGQLDNWKNQFGEPLRHSYRTVSSWPAVFNDRCPFSFAGRNGSGATITQFKDGQASLTDAFQHAFVATVEDDWNAGQKGPTTRLEVLTDAVTTSTS